MEALHRHSHPGLDRGGVYLSLPEIPSTSSCFSISASVRSTTPLTAGVLPPPSSCSPVCSAPQGPDCGAGPHRHLPVSDQREPAARCLLAEGGKPGKSEHPSILFFYFFVLHSDSSGAPVCPSCLSVKGGPTSLRERHTNYFFLKTRHG